MKKPEYRLRDEITITTETGQVKTLPIGSCITPVYYGYLPTHFKDAHKNRFFNPKTEQFCYTRYGLIAIPIHLIMEVTW